MRPDGLVLVGERFSSTILVDLIGIPANSVGVGCAGGLCTFECSGVHGLLTTGKLEEVVEILTA